MIFRRSSSSIPIAEMESMNLGNSRTGNGRSSSSNSMSSSRPVPYPYLLKAQLARFRPLLRGDYELNNKFNFTYRGYDVCFDVSADCHTFMVSATVFRVSSKEEDDSLETLATRFLEIEQSLVDIRMEWNEDYDIILYQNLPIGLVQEDCLQEFQTVLNRFLSEIPAVHKSLQPVKRRSSRRTSSTNKASSHKPKLMKIFGGRAA